MAVLVALQLAHEFRAAGSQAGDDGVDVLDGERALAEARGVRRCVPVAALVRRVWNFVSSSRPWPSGVCTTAISARTPSSPTTRSTHRPSTSPSPGSSSPSSTKNSVAAARSSTMMPTWSIRWIAMWYSMVVLLFRRAARPWPLVSLGRSRQDILDIRKRAEFPMCFWPSPPGSRPHRQPGTCPSARCSRSTGRCSSTPNRTGGPRRLVLVLGGSAFIGDRNESQMRLMAHDVTGHLFDAGHDLVKEVPDEVADVVLPFLAAPVADIWPPRSAFEVARKPRCLVAGRNGSVPHCQEALALCITARPHHRRGVHCVVGRPTPTGERTCTGSRWSRG